MQKLFFGYSADRVDEKNPLKRTPNTRILFAELRDILINKIGCAPSFEKLPALAEAWYIHGNESAKRELLEAKKQLAWMLVSGFCPIHHANATLQYNSCVQVDIDFKTANGQKMALDALQKIKTLQPDGVLFAGLSPSTFGLKIIFHTTATEIGQHPTASKQAIQYLVKLLQIDEKYFDSLAASQPCFLPYERTPGQHYWQPDATKFDVCFLPAVVEDQRPTFKPFEISRSADDVRLAVEFLQGNGKAWTANGRRDYLTVMIACKSLFSDGETVAWNILENCPQWIESTTRKQWSNQWRAIKTNQSESGKILFKLAYTAGWESPQQRSAREWKEQKAQREREWKEKRRQQSPPPAPDLNNLKAEPGEYLAGVLQRHGLPLNRLIGKAVISPTGSGKTTAVAEIVKRYPEKKVILIVPTIALVNRVSERHSNAVKFVGGTRKLDGSERFVVSTANSFPALASRVNLREWDIFFDEAHGFTSDTARGYKLKCLRRFHAIAKDLAKSVTYLTGTDLYNFHPDFLKLQRVTITAPRRVSKSATLLDAKNVLSTAVQSVRASVEAGRFPVLLLNDKHLKLAEVKTALSDLNLAVLNSETKEDALFLLITKTGAIPAGVQAIITTSVFREGNDIHDGRAFDFFVVGAHHSSAIEQLSARARNAKEVRVLIIRGADRKTNSRQFDPIKYAELVSSRAQSLCDEQNNLVPTDDTSALFFERNLRRAIQYTPVFDDEDGRLQVDFFGVNNEVFLAETAHEYQNDIYLKSALLKYGFAAESQTDICEDQHGSELQAGIKVARELCKAEKKAAHLKAVETLKNSINPANEIRQAENAGRVPKAYQFAKGLEKDFGIPIRAAVDLLPNIDTPKKFALLKNQIQVDCLRANTKYLQSGRIVGLIIQKIDQVFKDGATLHAADIRARLYDCLSLDRSINLDFLRPDPNNKQDIITANRKAVALLRMFFGVEHSGRDSKRMCHRNKKYTLSIKNSFSDTIPSEQKPNVDFEARVERSFLGAILEDAPF